METKQTKTKSEMAKVETAKPELKQFTVNELMRRLADFLAVSGQQFEVRVKSSGYISMCPEADDKDSKAVVLASWDPDDQKMVETAFSELDKISKEFVTKKLSLLKEEQSKISVRVDSLEKFLKTLG